MVNSMGTALLRLGAFLLTAILVPSFAAAQPTSGAKKAAAPCELFITFGDSLADTGNVFAMTELLRFAPAIPPSRSPNRTYFDGRFSNGPVAFEYLWDAIRGSRAPLQPVLRLHTVPRRGGVDFAFGGSTSGFVSETPGGFFVPGLRGQVELFRLLKRRALPTSTLAAMVTGSNDYLTTPPTPPAQPPVVVANIIAALEQLHATGINIVVVLNLPDLGAVPLVATRTAEERAGLSVLSAAHNALLQQALADLAARRPQLRVVPIDVADVTGALGAGVNVAVPAVDALVGSSWPYPFPASACLFVDPATCPDVPTFDAPPVFFYWDAVHPTTAVHLALASYLASKLP